MVNNCANPECAKPLHYLREGRVFVFEMSNKITDIVTGEKRPRRLEHFWLCGECSQQFEVQKAETGVLLAPRRRSVVRSKDPILDKALAS